MKNKTNIILKIGQLVIALSILCTTGFSQQLLVNTNNKQAPKITDPTDLHVSISQGSDNLGCFYDIKMSPAYTIPGPPPNPLCNVAQFPHGMYVEFTGATITSVSTTNTWLLSAPRTPSNVAGSNFVYWNKSPLGDCSNPINAIPPYPASINVKIRVNTTSNMVTVTVRNLTGNAWPNSWPPPPIPTSPNGWLYQYAPNSPYWNFWDCGVARTFSCPMLEFNIGHDDELCYNSLLNLNIIPTPPPGSTVEWYFSNQDPCPGTNPPVGWETPPYQGSSFNAGYLTAPSYCFVAVIKTGCCTYYSNVRHITVCNGPPSAFIQANPSNLININNEWHACQSWQGTLNLNPLPLACITTINWQMRWKYFDGFTWGSWSPWSPSLGNSTSTPLQTLTTDDRCAKMIEYKATLINICGTSTPSFVIVIDRIPDGGFIQTLTSGQDDIGFGTQTAPIVCKETRLIHNPSCGILDHWESCEETTPCSGTFGPWTDIPGSFGTSQWWTNPNPLTKTTKYRVWVINGACNLPGNGTYSDEITVTVIPEPTVYITANTNLICPGSTPTLTATTNLPSICIPFVPVTYQWYKGLNPIPGATTSSYHPTGPGNYYVIFTSTRCYISAKSNIITICKPLLEILGPCCICPEETVTLLANFKNMDPCEGSCNYTYLWSTGETTQQISVNQPGLYSVTVSCGLCVQTSQITVAKCVE